jgi:uncharacterized membrane protein (DUF4010 family)
MVDPLPFLQDLGLTLLLGSLIGLERERDRQSSDTHEFGGIRTLSLLAVLGYVIYSLSADSVLFFIVTGGFLLLLTASYVMSSLFDRTTGATTEIACIFTYFVGVLMAMDQTLIATVITLLVVVLLYFKQALHRFAHKVEKVELYDTLKFVAIVFVILPLLPNRTFGPLDVLNPYEIWLLVVLISSISFASYVAIKSIGPKKGIGMGGFLGGLISSTAVALSFSELSKKSSKIVNPIVFAILIASSAMFFRVLFTISVLNMDLLPHLLLPLGLTGLVGLLFAAYYWFSEERQSMTHISAKDLNLQSPFRLGSALQFGLLFAGLLFISKFAADYFGSEGVYATAFFSGLFDVDAITVSMSELSQNGTVSAGVASWGIVIATMTNTLSKGVIVLIFASRKVGLRVLLALLVLAMLGLGTYGFTAI